VFIGMGTLINVGAILLGSLLGLLVGRRLPQRTSDLVVQVLGLFVLVIGGYAVADGLSPVLTSEVGPHAGMLIVVGSLLVGALIGSGVQLEAKLNNGATWLQNRLMRGKGESSRFAEGAVTATLVFCIGPLAVLGTISEGVGTGSQQLLIKAVLDGFSSIAFAASLGAGVMVSALAVGLYQGTLTLLGWWLGSFLSQGQIDALGATGGVILLGMGVRLMGVKHILVGDLLPGLLIAPAAVWAVSALI
jgi:uncharacterized membrane protein YqgA involved in biofilm formation